MPREGRRSKHSGLLDAYAECGTCAWACSGVTALLQAANHADHTGHSNVRAEQTIGVTYNRSTIDNVPLPLG